MADDGHIHPDLVAARGGQIELKLESLLGRINVFAVLNGMERRRRAKRKKESL
jgi:hypothetical protein